MKHLIKLSDFTKEDVKNIFSVADELEEISNYLLGKTVILFFPDSSLRTRVTFEKGISLLGGQSIAMSNRLLDTEEDIKDFVGYLGNIADCIIVRHDDDNLIEEMAKYSSVPIINAMSKDAHPCEVLADLYAFSKERIDYMSDDYLFVGPKGNIGYSYLEAANILGLSFLQCCPKGFEMPGAEVEYDMAHAIQEKDVILTDMNVLAAGFFGDYQITSDLMELADDGAVLNPCPPFIRGREVSDEVIDSDYFVGYDFKKRLMKVEQAIILYCMGDMQEGMSLGWLGEPML